ncbi:PREDICTED: uncharacterized protein LOC109153022 isoform X2 [Ipomoea nil]|uniref:uncharacterized protein LOC109153022 isoform X2 n=1 Tax=Ipomoea nil TaxID=35883 RepID=UPI000901A2D0|nr:PREDICTED: uncharacterized protein LOC109153022 isoform X2 [Ipomoea nil]
MELEFDKYCVVDGSPTTVLPAPRHCPKLEDRRSKRKQKYGNQKLCLNQDFTQNNFHHYRSVSCKDSLSRSELGNEVLRRGSAYCSSKELRRFQKTDNAGEERRKIEFSSGCITASSFGIVDALCSSEEDSSQVEENTSSDKGASLGNRKNRYEGNKPRETDHSSAVFPKSLSAKFRRVPHSPAQSESDCSRASSSKSRFTPMRKMFDPFRKSKSQRSPLSNKCIESGLGDLECKLASLNGNKGSRKHLPPNFSNTTQQFNCGSLPSRKGSHNSLASFLPTHLHGFLQLDRKHGVPFFEFSVNFPEDVFLAKTWKVGNTSNWVYTFYSVRNRRKSHGSGRGSNDGTKESSLLVGQMQVSSYYLCSKVKNATGVSNNYSMVMEFVLYDSAKANPRKSVSSWGSSSPSSVVPNGDGKGHTGTHPVSAAELHEQQQLEIAAIVIEVPVVQKRESLEFKSEFKNDQSTLLGFPFFEGADGNVNPSRVAAVTPSGNHSLPTTESRGPSPLLDRWRSGGGCDCGGWDMACPLNVFYNLNIQSAADCPLIDNERPLQLFIQGKKDKMPALSVRRMEGGQYGVDFDAQLSALQAFSISVAILHAMEAAALSCMEKEEEGRSEMQEESGELLGEDEVRNSTKTVREEGNKKVQQPSFVLNPPFSPIARV